MVAKVVVGKSIRGILNYNENKVKEGTATLIMANNFGAQMDKLNFYDKLARFEKLMEKNTRAKTNALHISLNFGTSETLSKDKLKLIAEAYMKKIGFDG